MQLLNVTRWPVVVVFLIAGLMVVLSAFTTVNLFTQAMANVAFIERHGLVALQSGALWQLAELTFWGVLALAGFMGFKICETELVRRYRAWAAPDEAAESRETD